jgi:uncharacterized protein YbbK (DUF523 family)
VKKDFPMKNKFIVSACLAGIHCRYNRKASPCKQVIDLVNQGKAITVCPEILGGMTTPREPAECNNNKIITKSGEDLTNQFIDGAKEALIVAKTRKCNMAILKSKSPSCGYGEVYDGTFSGKLIPGNGVFTNLLLKEKIKVFTENELPKNIY